MFYENYLTSDFHINKHCYFRRACLLVKMASKTVIRPINWFDMSRKRMPIAYFSQSSGTLFLMRVNFLFNF